VIDRLFVIIGAGASFDCTPGTVPRANEFWPPLTPQLFTPGPGYSPILAQYPLAKAVAAELSAIAPDALRLEKELRERYRDSEHAHDRRKFLGVLPYLQELLYTVSYKYTDFPQNYEVLVTKLLRLPSVVFISLNYDLLLDNALLAYDNDKAIGWYLRDGRNWSLIKLHGSVDWGRKILGEGHGIGAFTDPSEETRIAAHIEQRSGDLATIRGFHSAAHTGNLYFPALAAPVGQADELVCPPQHVDFLKRRLTETQPLHLLVIGYSGLDHEVVSLIRESERGVKTLTIVDNGEEAAWEVANRLVRQGITTEDAKFAHWGFNEWVRDGGLDNFLAEMTNREL
jgi:hypothetical protein